MTSATPAQSFRREIPTLDGGRIVVTSGTWGIHVTLDPGDAGVVGHEEALDLSDAFATAAAHQRLVARTPTGTRQ